MSDSQHDPGLAFLVRWIPLTSIGYAAGFLVGFVAGNFLLGNVMIGVCTAGTVGYAQYLAHRQITQRPGIWTLSGMMVLFPVLVVYSVIVDVIDYPFDRGWPHGIAGWSIAFLAGGTAIGLIQSHMIALERSTTIWWAVTCAIGWGASVFGLSVQIYVPRSAGSMMGALGFLMSPLVAGLILGVITGLSIVMHRKTRK